MSKIKELKEKRASVFGEIDQLRKATDGRDQTTEERAKWERLNTDYDALDKKVEDEVRFAEIEKKQVENTAERAAAKTGDERDEEYRSAFWDYVRSGNREKLNTAMQQRAGEGINGMSSAIITPKLLHNAIEVAMKAYGGMIQAGTIITTTSGNDLVIPTINDTANKAKIVETYKKSETGNMEFDSVTLRAFTYRTPIVPIAVELLQDSQFNLEQLVGTLLGESFARGLNEHLTTGAGGVEPEGIVTCATACDTVAAVNGIKLENLLDLMKSVNSAYGNNGKFMLNRETLFALRALKGTDGRFIWNESVAQGFAPTLFGKEYITNDDMAGVGAGNASVLFGDLSKYRIRMVRDFTIVRLNEVLAEYLAIGLMGFARADGVLLDAGTNPVKKLVHANA